MWQEQDTVCSEFGASRSESNSKGESKSKKKSNNHGPTLRQSSKPNLNIERRPFQQQLIHWRVHGQARGHKYKHCLSCKGGDDSWQLLEGLDERSLQSFQQHLNLLSLLGAGRSQGCQAQPHSFIR